MVSSRICFHCATKGTPEIIFECLWKAKVEHTYAEMKLKWLRDNLAWSSVVIQASCYGLWTEASSCLRAFALASDAAAHQNLLAGSFIFFCDSLIKLSLLLITLSQHPFIFFICNHGFSSIYLFIDFFFSSLDCKLQEPELLHTLFTSPGPSLTHGRCSIDVAKWMTMMKIKI